MSLKLRLTSYAYLVLYPGLASPIDAVSILVFDGKEAILIDSGTGLDASLKALAGSLAELGYPQRFNMRLVVNTHGHVNNAGGDWWAHDFLKATIAARQPDATWIEKGDPERTAAKDYSIRFRSVPVGLIIEKDPYSISIGDLEVRIIHTPGHTPGSQSIVIEGKEATIIAIGDALGSLSKRWSSNEDDWWKSFERIRGTESDILCTSIRCYIGSAVKEYLDLVEKEGPSWIDEEDS